MTTLAQASRGAAHDDPGAIHAHPLPLKVLFGVYGVLVVFTVLTGMSHTAMILGLSWLGVGLAYGAILAKRRRVSLEL